jgi:hypothetical protein
MADDVLHGGSADDTIVGTDADENLSGGAGGDDKISGGSSDDYLIGGTGNDTLNGSSGNDTLDGGSGNDQLNGDAGYDTAVYNGSVFDYSFSISSPSSTITDANLSDGDDGTDTLKDVEEVQFADATIYLDGRNNDPLVAADYLFMQEDQSLSVAFADQLANDLGVEGDTITLESVGNAVNGTVSLDGSGNVVFTPNSDLSGTASFEYTVSDGQGGFNSGTVTVEVEAVADAPKISTTDASGTEDTAIALDLSAALSDTDGSESLSINIAGVPSGATLSAGTDNGDGTYTLTAVQLAGLTITPPANSDADFLLTVTATSTEASNGDEASATTTLNVAVTAIADAPIVAVTAASGDEDTAIALDIASALTDADGSESLSINISGVPAGAALSAGTNIGDGSYTLTVAQLVGLTVTPAADSDADFTLSVTATSTEASSGDQASTVATLNVAVSAVADVPTVNVSNADQYVGDVIPLDISAALTDIDGSESLTIEISGVPSGSRLSGGQVISNDGTTAKWLLQATEINGLTVLPAANAPGEASLTVTAVATEGSNGSRAVSSDTIAVTFNRTPEAVDDQISSFEDTPITIYVLANDSDPDVWDSISVSSVDASAFDAEGNIVGSTSLNPGGTISFSSINNWSGVATFEYTITDTKGKTDAATTTITVNAAADEPTVAVSVDVDQPQITIFHLDGPFYPDDQVTVVIDGLSTTITMNSGTDDGANILKATNQVVNSIALAHPALTVLSDVPGDIKIRFSDSSAHTVTAGPVFDSGIGGDQAPISTSVETVRVASVSEDTSVALNIDAALPDTDGSESLSITIAGVPNGATLSAGTDNGGGSYTLSPAQIEGLKITPAVNSDEDFTLTVTATSTEASSGNQASTVTILNVAVAADADAPVVSVSGSELSGTVGWSYQPEHVVVEGVGGTTDIAVLADGGHIVVYSKGGIVARRYGVDGNPVGSEFVIDDVGGGGIWPSVAARDDGGFVITWSGGDVDGK